MEIKKFLPLTWFCFGIIAADCIVTIILIRLGWAYEANKLFNLVKLPIELSLIFKFIGAAIGLVAIEYFRQKFDHEERFAFWAVMVLAIVYATVMIIAWTNLVIQFLQQSNV